MLNVEIESNSYNLNDLTNTEQTLRLEEALVL